MTMRYPGRRDAPLIAVLGLVLLGALAFGAAPALASLGYGFTGSFGSATSTPANPDPLSDPTGVAVNDTTGDFYVLDRGNDRVEWFSSMGTYEGQFDGGATPAKSFSSPEGIAIDNSAEPSSKGDVYVVDTGHDVIDKFSETGTYLGQLTGTCEHENESAVEPGACPGSASKKVIPFDGVFGVAVDPAGNVWVNEEYPDGPGGVGDKFDEFSDTGSFVGTFEARHDNPTSGLAVDSSDNVYTLVGGGPYVLRLESTIPGHSEEDIFDANATGLAIDPATNDLFVDHANTIAEYAPPEEKYATPFAQFANTENLTGGSGIAVSSATGTVYAADSVGNDVAIYMPEIGEAPFVESESAPAPKPAEATLAATINTYGQETTYEFDYATKATGQVLEGTIVKVPGGTLPEGRVGGQPVSVGTGAVLPEGTTYFYRVVATNATDRTTKGKVEQFTTQGPPLVSSGEAQNITRTSAVFSGTVDPVGVETTYYFEYVTEAGYQAALAKGAANPYAEGEATALFSAGSSYETRAVAPILAAGLLQGTTYRYALIAKNALGVTIGPGETLTTTPLTPPILSTGPASAVSQNSATLSGTVDTNSLQTEYGFEIGTEPGNYGPATGLGSLGGALTEPVTLTLGELQPGTTYYYRVTATSADGTSYGEPQSFTTPGFPTLLTTPTSPPLIAYTSPGFPAGSLANTGTSTETKTLTNAEKLSKALKACHAKKGKKRSSCEAAAHKKYAPANKKKGATKKK